MTSMPTTPPFKYAAPSTRSVAATAPSGSDSLPTTITRYCLDPAPSSVNYALEKGVRPSVVLNVARFGAPPLIAVTISGDVIALSALNASCGSTLT